MLAMGLTTTPEQPEPTRSDSHAWSAHPDYGLLATVLGIGPAAPSFRLVRVAPHLGPLQHAEGRVPHPYGPIDVELVRRGTDGVAPTDAAFVTPHHNGSACRRAQQALRCGASAFSRADAPSRNRAGGDCAKEVRQGMVAPARPTPTAARKAPRR
jgi:hypothetical protein